MVLFISNLEINNFHISNKTQLNGINKRLFIPNAKSMNINFLT